MMLIYQIVCDKRTLDEYVGNAESCVVRTDRKALHQLISGEFIRQMNGPTLPAPLEALKEARAESSPVSRESNNKRIEIWVNGVEPSIWRYADCLTSMPFLKKWR